jgi:hypothetical protein
MACLPSRALDCASTSGENLVGTLTFLSGETGSDAMLWPSLMLSRGGGTRDEERFEGSGDGLRGGVGGTLAVDLSVARDEPRVDRSRADAAEVPRLEAPILG